MATSQIKGPKESGNLMAKPNPLLKRGRKRRKPEGRKAIQVSRAWRIAWLRLKSETERRKKAQKISEAARQHEIRRNKLACRTD
jgi:hypothetical protein